MAIENERKVLLDLTQVNSLLTDLRTHQAQFDVQFMDITQGYLNGSSRIRHVVPHNPQGGKDEYHIFTYKTKVTGNTVEIETEISIHDYHKLFLVVKPVILKTRAKIVDGCMTWDIDFFKTPKSGAIYLAMAEVEMPEFKTDAPPVHQLLEPYALKWIDFGDKRFNNKNLANPNKVQKLLKDLDSAK